jgi:hypothetical protein
MSEASGPETVNRYPMLYVGRGLYGVQKFVAEAEKLGVNRALPERIVGSLMWGDPVLLGEWRPNMEAQRATMLLSMMDSDAPIREPHSNKGLRFKRIGGAQVFGYFRVTGLNFTGPEAAKEALIAILDVVETVAVNQKVARQCGSYEIGSTSFVRDTIADIVEKAQVIETMMNIRFKWFVTGKFEPFGPLDLADAKFSRGVVGLAFDAPLDLNDAKFEGEGTQHPVSFLYDYNRRIYLRKDSKEVQ